MADRRASTRPVILAVAMAVAAVGGCADRDPRIVATFRQGSGAYGYTSTLGGGAYYYYNPPTVSGGNVYIGTSRKFWEAPGPDNYFFKLDGGLRKVWEYALGYGEVRGGAAVDVGGRIYFVVETGRALGDASHVTDTLFCLDGEGRLQWRFAISGPPGATGGTNEMGMLNPAIAADGTIYVGGAKLYALSPGGAEIWEYPANRFFYGGMKNAPIIDPAGNVYFVAEGALQCVRPDGTAAWAVGGGRRPVQPGVLVRLRQGVRGNVRIGSGLGWGPLPREDPSNLEVLGSGRVGYSHDERWAFEVAGGYTDLHDYGLRRDLQPSGDQVTAHWLSVGVARRFAFSRYVSVAAEAGANRLTYRHVVYGRETRIHDWQPSLGVEGRADWPFGPFALGVRAGVVVIPSPESSPPDSLGIRWLHPGAFVALPVAIALSFRI